MAFLVFFEVSEIFYAFFEVLKEKRIKYFRIKKKFQNLPVV